MTLLELIGFCPWNRQGCQVVFAYWRTDKVRSCPNDRCRRTCYRAIHARKPENVETAKRLLSNTHQQELLDWQFAEMRPENVERSKQRFLGRFVGRCTQQQRGCKQIVFKRKHRLMVCANPKCLNRYWTDKARRRRRTLLEMDDF